MQESERGKRLWALAEQDDIYLIWKEGFEMCERPFREYVEACPEEIRRMLCGYAECGQMMCQRVVNIACKYMDFLESDQK